MLRAALERRSPSEEMQSILAEAHELGKKYTCQVFRPDLEATPDEQRGHLVDAVVAVTSWPHWQGLRRDQQLEVSAAKSVMALELHALVGQR